MCSLIERLESRTFLSAAHPAVAVAVATAPVVTQSADHHTLTVTNARNVQITEVADGFLDVTDKYTGITQHFGGGTEDVAIKTLRVYGTSAADRMSFGGWTVNATFYGYAGDDTILVSDNGTGLTAGRTSVYGGTGNDTLGVTNSNFTVLSGDEGSDTFLGPSRSSNPNTPPKFIQ